MAHEHIEKLESLIEDTDKLSAKIKAGDSYKLETIEGKKAYTADVAEFAKKHQEIETSINGFREEMLPLSNEREDKFKEQRKQYIQSYQDLGKSYKEAKVVAEEQNKQIQAFNKATAELEKLIDAAQKRWDLCDPKVGRSGQPYDDLTQARDRLFDEKAAELLRTIASQDREYAQKYGEQRHEIHELHRGIPADPNPAFVKTELTRREKTSEKLTKEREIANLKTSITTYAGHDIVLENYNDAAKTLVSLSNYHQKGEKFEVGTMNEINAVRAKLTSAYEGFEEENQSKVKAAKSQLAPAEKWFKEVHAIHQSNQALDADAPDLKAFQDATKAAKTMVTHFQKGNTNIPVETNDLVKKLNDKFSTPAGTSFYETERTRLETAIGAANTEIARLETEAQNDPALRAANDLLKVTQETNRKKLQEELDGLNALKKDIDSLKEWDTKLDEIKANNPSMSGDLPVRGKLWPHEHKEIEADLKASGLDGNWDFNGMPKVSYQSKEGKVYEADYVKGSSHPQVSFNDPADILTDEYFEFMKATFRDKKPTTLSFPEISLSKEEKSQGMTAEKKAIGILEEWNQAHPDYKLSKLKIGVNEVELPKPKAGAAGPQAGQQEEEAPALPVPR